MVVGGRAGAMLDVVSDQADLSAPSLPLQRQDGDHSHDTGANSAGGDLGPEKTRRGHSNYEMIDKILQISANLGQEQRLLVH